MKKCIICGKPAKYVIKGTNNYYCEDCAKELFSDLSFLVEIDNFDHNKIWNDEIEDLNNLENDQKFFDKFVNQRHE